MRFQSDGATLIQHIAVALIVILVLAVLVGVGWLYAELALFILA